MSAYTRLNMCYKCGIEANSFCKCLKSCRKCPNNHQWVECPDHRGSIIINPRIVSNIHKADFICDKSCKYITDFEVYLTV